MVIQKKQSIVCWVVTMAVAVIAAACGSDSDEPAVESTAEAVEEVTEADDAGDAPEAETAAQDDAAAADATAGTDGDGPMVVIEGTVNFGDFFGSGEWTVTEGADVLGCSGGSLIERPAVDQVAMRLTCEDPDTAGSIVGRFLPAPSGSAFTSGWEVILADGAFTDLSGTGTWSSALAADGASAEVTVEMDVESGAFAVPTTSVDRLVQATESLCFDGLITIDGLVEYATTEDGMQRLDLATGERTDHGPAPEPCAWWLGDPELGRRVVVSPPFDATTGQPLSEHRVWMGPFDGEFDVELTYDETVLLINRSLVTNRVVLAFEDSGRVFLLDATTGETVGEPIDGSFPIGRQALAVVPSPNASLIAMGGADVSLEAGLVLVLDALTGEERLRTDVEHPPAALVFDPTTGDILLGSSTGEILTMDVASGEVTPVMSLGADEPIQSMGVRDTDGKLVVALGDRAVLIDLATGSIDDEIVMKHSGASRIRPDGSINSATNVQVVEVYEIAG